MERPNRQKATMRSLSEEDRASFVDYLKSITDELAVLDERNQLLKLANSHYEMLQKALNVVADDAGAFGHEKLQGLASTLTLEIDHVIRNPDDAAKAALTSAVATYLGEARATLTAEQQKSETGTPVSTHSISKVLLVDDEHFVHRLVSRAIGDDVMLFSAYNGAAAIETIRTERPDLIILDVRMPGQGGTEILKDIKDMPEGQDIPVLMLSNFDSDQNVVASIVSGAIDFMSKSVPAPELKSRILEVLHGGRARPPA